MFVFCKLTNLLVARVPISPYTFLSVSSELSEDVCFLLQKLKREEKLCGLSTGHSACRAAPWDARAFWAKWKQGLIWKTSGRGSHWTTRTDRQVEERGNAMAGL